MVTIIPGNLTEWSNPGANVDELSEDPSKIPSWSTQMKNSWRFLDHFTPNLAVIPHDKPWPKPWANHFPKSQRFWHCTSGELQPLSLSLFTKSNPTSKFKMAMSWGFKHGSHVSCLTQRQAAIPKTSVHPSPAPSCAAGVGRCQCVPVQWWMSRKIPGLFDTRGMGLLNDPTGM